jgi:ribose 5-phosphate isomerase A
MMEGEGRDAPFFRTGRVIIMAANRDELKHEAALKAVEYVRDGMAVGLGSGSTAEHAVRELGRRVREEGLSIRGVPTSEKVGRLAEEVGVPLTTLEECPQLDVTIDGADEVDLKTLDAIKGLGGALLREKIVAEATLEEIFIVDESKVVRRLGEHTGVPVEVVPFGWSRTCEALHRLGCTTTRRVGPDAEPYLTDSGNYLIDCRFKPIADPEDLGDRIKVITGVVEHGLFVGIGRRVVVASESGIQVVEL